ncbi:NahK/ErcS family hybrid sensor histidine kinase/response regulator [Pseudoxanthomonas sp. UTMC 1351]|uniref:NahK/ErcS family hybrid sensor histidine kinase/response regulator n=1 Tax=Pseudoxanthomonas sp. UTMC 1351 TaxID=2695853 RepID=UPI0034CFDF16
MLSQTRPRFRLLLIGSAIALVIGLLSWLVAHETERRSLLTSAIQAREQLRVHDDALQAVIERYRVLPAVLAMDPEVGDALEQAMLKHGALDAADVDRLNRKLEQVNGAAATSTLTLLDRRGYSIAASNWRRPDSNVGVDYGFRPYFQKAMANGVGDFYALGYTTGVPGYFLSQAVRDDEGQVIGVVVVKLVFNELEAAWRNLPDHVFVSDAHGIIFLSGRERWRYKDLRPLRADERVELARTRQYGDVPLRLLNHRDLGELTAGVHRIRVPQAGELLWLSQPLPKQNWTLHLLRPTRPAQLAGQTAGIAVAAGLLATTFLLLFMQQRRRMARLRERSRVELQQLVEQHAIELRTAQDGLVQAAGRADYGESPSLQHLPQGVCVIDADLRLVAWNRRYIELFKFPAGFIHVGRPIEDVFRYNARRGLLGPGPIEEAIARRLDHLRSGKPHMHERERGDGTVIEIRGNPLPDGGFVTSYADITAYKQAARELRSLADALEHRIEERTRDLAVAKREAESANRSKTSFVAAAVHDLLQPLNAARMFVSALRGRLDEPGAQQIADNVEGALAAQDAILNSLLDISRLESGALETRVQDFALGPLLETLAREFGMLARERGLKLDYVATRAVVRTDEALLRRILQNFLSNAIRYTPKGRILLGCRRTKDGLRIEVHDTGPGIPKSRQREIFEEFRRLDDGTVDDRGAGLGLAIVERIARLLDHSIGLRSTVGQGSVFSIVVPWGEADAVIPDIASVESEDDTSLRGCLVWCIDDDPRVCEASRTLLERWSCRVVLAAGVNEALAAAQPGGAPGILLLDVRLGQTTGPELYTELAERWGQDTAVILVTAERDDAVRALARERGWGFLSKPVRPAALRALMMQMLLRSGERTVS